MIISKLSEKTVTKELSCNNKLKNIYTNITEKIGTIIDIPITMIINSW